MERNVAAVVAGGLAAGLVAGFGAPVLAASEGRDAPTPGPVNTYSNGTSDGWHTYGSGGFWNSSQLYTYTQSGGSDEAWWKFDHNGTYTSVQFWDTASGLMTDYASYGTYNKRNNCVNQGAYSNVWVTVLTNAYEDGQVQVIEPGCVIAGGSIGADAVQVNW
jgi:hypothetical protein